MPLKRLVVCAGILIVTGVLVSLGFMSSEIEKVIIFIAGGGSAVSLTGAGETNRLLHPRK
jgi:hypothetical protein